MPGTTIGLQALPVKALFHQNNSYNQHAWTILIYPFHTCKLTLTRNTPD